MTRTAFVVFALLISVIAADAQGVEGYVWPLSVRPGQTLDLFVSGALMPNDPQQPNSVQSAARRHRARTR